MKTTGSVLLFLSSIFYLIPEAIAARGTFTATEACPAYHSLQQKNNPEQLFLRIGQVYKVAQTSRQPVAYRVILSQGSQPRWVEEHCGNFTATTPVDCHTPNQEDSYVLSMSWQPAFCETHRGKPECQVTDCSAYEANHFTLHGLWPNKSSCGTNYGFCGQYTHQLANFCDYAPVPSSGTVLQVLNPYMPAAVHGSCLQRHEWYKHGTCQDQTAVGYFSQAVHLLQDWNQSEAGQYITENIGKMVSTDEFLQRIDQAFGVNAHQNIILSCSKNNLVQVDIHLPKTLGMGTSLSKLMATVEGTFSSNCGSSFFVDPIGFSAP